MVFTLISDTNGRDKGDMFMAMAELALTTQRNSDVRPQDDQGALLTHRFGMNHILQAHDIFTCGAKTRVQVDSDK
jgi:hypothetical protein